MTGLERTKQRIALLDHRMIETEARIDELVQAYRNRLTAMHAGKMAAAEAEARVLRSAVADVEKD